jgi:hypothetical protein
MHVAAALKDTEVLKALAAKGGDLFKKNSSAVSAVDILFNAVENDPLKVSKAQLLLGLMSLGGIIANSCVLPMVNQETASYWSAGLLLISTGTDLALSYNAYCQLNPENALGKVLYWATTLGTLPVHAVMNKLPGAKVIWDMWRMSSVCKRAMSQIRCAYQNCEYDTKRSLQVLGAELLTVGTSAYHTRESFTKIKQACERAYYFSEEVKAWETERSNQQSELQKAQKQLANDRKAFTKLKSQWESEVEKQPVCKKVLADAIQTATEKVERTQQNWEAKL